MSSPAPNRRDKRRRAEEEDADDSGRGASERDVEMDEDEEGEDLLGDNMADDYKELGVLDSYDRGMLDDKEQEELDIEGRARAEAALAERDRREGRRAAGARLGAAFASEEDEEEEASGSGIRERRRRRREEEDAAGAGAAEAEPFDLDTFHVPLKEWVSQDQTKAEIKRRFRKFLSEYMAEGSGELFHDKVIDDMVGRDGSSMPISYLHLSRFAPQLAIWLADVPKAMLALFDDVAKEVVLSRYADYWMISDEIHVRVTDLPIPDSLRDLRQVHLNVLVRVTGVVTKRTGVFPQLKLVRYNCVKCGSVSPPVRQSTEGETKVGSCADCQSEGPFSINAEQTVYGNYQKITLQESPGSVPAGRVPRTKDVILLADMIDAARPGEEVEVTGIYTHMFDSSLNTRQGFPVFSTIIEANYIAKKSDAAAHLIITDDDRAKIDAIKDDPKVIRRIIRSIAPSIYGNEDSKLAVALAMFGGREKNVNNKHRIRGDINVLLLGDPGTAKSQMLKYVEKTAPRCVYTTGKGASAVGLTAAVHKDPITGEWTLEGGALVLADRGVCCIDEFDKMTDQDRTSIHEAMEQQSISISKAGIVTTLQARCSVVAAANPIGGRYDSSKTFSENVQLTDPILTRFDVLVVLKDEVDPVKDTMLAEFVVRSHVASHPEVAKARATAAKLAEAAAGGADASSAGPDPASAVESDLAAIVADLDAARAGAAVESAAEGDLEPIDQTLLRKYILHARSIKPALTNIDQGKVARLYSELRRESEVSNGVPIAVRHIESIMRMAEASARMRLSALVSESDLNLAIKCMLSSFISAQKLGAQRALRLAFSRYMSRGESHEVLLLIKLKQLVKERVVMEEAIFRGGAAGGAAADGVDRIEIKLSDLVERARRHGVTELDSFLKSEPFRTNGFEYDAEKKIIVFSR